MRISRSLSVQTTFIYTGLFAVSVAALFGILWWQSSGLMRAELDSRVARESDRLIEIFNSRGVQALRAEIDFIGRDPGAAIYWLVDAGGVKLNGNLDRVPALVSSRALANDWIEFDYLEADTRATIRGRRMALSDNLNLFVGRNLTLQSQLRQTFGSLFVIALLMIIALGLIGGRWLAFHIDRRFYNVNKTISEIMAGDLTQRIPLRGNHDAFDHLAENFNSMLDRITELLAAMRDVSDNIAHDLRTPLNRIKNRLEIIAKRQESDLPMAYEEIETVLEDINNVIVTFNALLSLSRLESGAAPLAIEETDLTALLRSVAEIYSPLVEDHGARLDLDVPDTPVTAAVSSPLLTQALTNILDNALKYGLSAGGCVLLALRSSPTSYDILVSDDGAGVAPDEHARVLRRFGRLDDARSSAGSGLGLPLVRAILVRHGGELRLEKTLPHGLTVIMSLPRG